jgi:hypothetical protein
MIAILLNWRTWAALGLVVSHWFAYHQGGLSKQVEFDAYVSDQQTAHIAALNDARAKEQTLQLANSKVQNDYQALKRKSADSASGAESERLLLIAALDAARAAAPNSPAGSGADASPTERVLRESVGRYEAVARDADRLSDQVTGLQGYVRSVCLR